MAKPRVRTSLVCLHNDKLLAFRAEDPTSKKPYVFLPGGQIEPNETAPEAAARETLEETGFLVRVEESSGVDREYLFHWDGQDFDCLTLFYRGHLTSPMQRKVEDAPYHRGVIWIPKSEIESTFSYSADILSAIQELLKD